MAEIPLDVLEVILALLAPGDVAVCCRVSRAVGALAVDALYRDLRPTQRNVLRLCLKLCNEPALAARARSLVINDNNVDMFLGLIADALPLLHRLHTLVLNIGPSPAWILPQQPPFRLRTLVCAFFLDPPLLAFLAAQPSIRHLSLTTLPSPAVLRALAASPALLPRLASIAAPLALVAALVPGRPVTDVTAHADPRPGTPPDIAALARSRAPAGVRRLMLNFRFLRAVPAPHLAAAAPALAALTLDADAVPPDDPDALDALAEWLEEYLAAARGLLRVTVRFHPVLSCVPVQELDFSDLITSVFGASASLTHVVIVFYGYRAKYVCHRVPGHDWYIVN